MLIDWKVGALPAGGLFHRNFTEHYGFFFLASLFWIFSKLNYTLFYKISLGLQWELAYCPA